MYPVEDFLSDYEAWLKQDAVTVASLPPSQSLSALKEFFLQRYRNRDIADIDDRLRGFRKTTGFLRQNALDLKAAGLLSEHPAKSRGQLPPNLLRAAHHLVVAESIEQPTTEQVSAAMRKESDETKS